MNKTKEELIKEIEEGFNKHSESYRTVEVGVLDGLDSIINASNVVALLDSENSKVLLKKGKNGRVSKVDECEYVDFKNRETVKEVYLERLKPETKIEKGIAIYEGKSYFFFEEKSLLELKSEYETLEKVKSLSTGFNSREVWERPNKVSELAKKILVSGLNTF